MLRPELNTITNYQEQSRGIRSDNHDEMLRENSDQNKAARLNYIDEANSEWEEPKGEMKRMTGGDNPFLEGSAGSMSYESRRKWILSSIDENLLNSDRSDTNNNSYTVDELKAFLRQLNLKVSGTKSELIERLLIEKDSLYFDVD